MALRPFSRLTRHQNGISAKQQSALRRYRPTLESLEDRVVPASVDMDTLRFEGDDLKSVGGTNYEATSGSVKVGFIPVDAAPFIPLMQFGINDGKVSLDTQAMTKVTVEDVVLYAIPDGQLSKIWTSASGKEIEFNLKDLFSIGGLALDEGNSEKMSVGKFNFTPTSLSLEQPTASATAYYEFETLHNDPVKGPTVFDTSGNRSSHDGFLQNGATIGTATSFGIADHPHAATGNKVLALDGTSQFMNVEDSLDLRPGKLPFSVSSWIYLTSGVTKEQVIAGQLDSTLYDGWAFGISATNQLFAHLGEKNNSTHVLTVTGNTNLTPGWHHVAFTFDGTGQTNAVQLYVNGVAETSLNVDGTLSLDPDIATENSVSFNAGNPGSTTVSPSTFHGYLDELAVWNGLLSPSQVNDLATGIKQATEVIATLPGGDRVKLQGTADFSGFSSLLKMIQIEVKGADYVVYDTTGSYLTGLDAKFTFPADEQFANFDIAGELDVGYSLANKRFHLGAGITISSQPEGTDQSPIIDGVGGSFSLDIATEPFELQLGIGLTGGFNLKGLSVQTDATNPPMVKYDFEQELWEVSGGVTANFRDKFSVGVLFLAPDGIGPGFVIKDGVLQNLTARINEEIDVFGTSLTTKDLNLYYDPANAVFQVYGGTVALHTTIMGVPESIEVGFGDQSEPGLNFKNKQLESLNIDLSGDFNFGIIGVHPENASLLWKTENNEDIFAFSGTMLFDFAKFKARFTVGNQGLFIRDGVVDVRDITVSLENVDFKIIEIQRLQVHFSQADNNGPFDLSVSLALRFPGNFIIGGGVSVVNNQFDAIWLYYDVVNFNPNAPTDPNESTDGIPILDSGLFVTHLEAEVKNIENPSNIVVSGSIELVFGKEVQIGTQNVAIFRAHGDLTVDKDQLILDGDAELGAYKVGNTWTDVLGGGQMQINLDWASGLYTAHIDVDGLGGFFTFEADFTFAKGKDIRILAEGFVTIPPAVPFIGGKKIGGIGIYYDHVFMQNDDPTTSSTVLAAWIELDIFKEVDFGFELLWDANNVGTFSLIGNGTVDQFKKPTPRPENRKYTYQVQFEKDSLPSSATAMTLGVDWSNANPNVKIIGTPVIKLQRESDKKIFTEADFTSANNLALITDPQLARETSKLVHIVGDANNDFAPIGQEYTLIVEIITDGDSPFVNNGDPVFTGRYHIPKPTLNLVAPAKPMSTFSVDLSGRTDPAFVSTSQVSLYVAEGNSTTGKLIGTTGITLQADQSSWKANIEVPLDSLYPTSYRLYAVLNQTTAASGDAYKHVAVQSDDVLMFEPEFAVYGSVANQSGRALASWTVFLDLNQNGTHDPGEPQKITNDQGFYSFENSAVPLNTPFNIQLVPYSRDYLVQDNPRTNLNYDGQTAVVADFTVKEKSGIRGIIVSGTNAPIINAAVYLDMDNDGKLSPLDVTVRTNSSGEYAFDISTPGTYHVGLVSKGPTSPAYVTPNSAFGTHGSATADQIALGMAFTVTEPIEISSLGIFDSAGDGFHGNLRTILYDRVTNKPIATVQFTQADSGTLSGGSRFKTLSQPVTLYAGFQGMIVSEGFSALDPWGDNIPANGPTNAGDNQLKFEGTGFYGQVGNYPSNVGGNQVPNPYMAGSFQYAVLSLTQTIPSNNGSIAVTIDNSGFDRHEGVDFHVESASTLSGTITGQQRSNGAVHPGTPQDGITVYLFQNEIVVSSTTTDAYGNYAFHAIRPGNYFIQQVIPGGYRQTTPFSGTLQLQQPAGSNIAPLPDSDVGGVVTADFDGDGKLEAVVLNRTNNTSPSFIVLTQSSFPKVSYSLNRASTQSDIVSMGPVLRTGSTLPDLITLQDSGVVELYAYMNGRLQNASVLTVLPEVFYADDNTFSNLVIGNFQSNVNAVQLAVVVSSNMRNESRVIVYTQGGQVKEVLTIPDYIPPSLSAGDVNGDGFTDLFVADRFNGGHFLLYSDGQGGFATPVSFPALTGSVGTLSDLNGDGLLDFALIDDGGGIRYVLQGPQGTFATEVTTDVIFGRQYEDFKLMDINGDFRNDFIVLVATQYEGLEEGLYVALNTGGLGNLFSKSQLTRWPQAFPLVETGASPTVAFVNWNENGLPDLIVTDHTNKILQLARNTSTITTAGFSVSIELGHDYNGLNFKNYQLNKTHNHQVSMSPSMGTGTWTVKANGNFLEIRDSKNVLISSRHLDDLNSLTIVTDDSRSHDITFDMSELHLSLPGGIQIKGSTRRNDTVRFLLGAQDDVVTAGNGRAIINGLQISWSNVETFIIKSGAGNDNLKVSGLLSGVFTLSGGEGDDTYVLATRNSTVNIYDTSGIDTLDFSQATSGVQVDLNRDRGQKQRYGAGNSLYVNGRMENLIGSDFNDELKGNSANNVILGGAGADKLWGGSGRDLLIGGLGRDTIRGGYGDSILIGGSTTFDEDIPALRAILAEWVVGRDYVARVKNLTDGSGSVVRRNGNSFLNRNTVLNDGVADLLIGGPGNDWFLGLPGDKTPDRSRRELLGWN